MFAPRKFTTLLLLLAACFTLLIITTAVRAQGPYKPGEKVEYRAQHWPEKWEVGTFVKVLPGGTQVLIAEKPNEFYPEGFQRAYALDEVRPVRKVLEEPARNDAPVPPDQPDKGAEPAKNNAPGPAGPQMSQQDVLSFLRQRLGDGDPFMNPKREQVLQDLRKEVLSRGVNFRYHAIGPFANDIGKFGPPTNVISSMFDNYGPPAKRDSLLGRWLFSKVGAPENPMFGTTSTSLTINPNGTYVWNTDSGIVRGNWRNATSEEMDKVDKGGEGLVLLSGKSGSDWIALKRDEEGPFGQGVKVYILPSHNLRENGTRG